MSHVEIKYLISTWLIINYRALKWHRETDLAKFRYSLVFGNIGLRILIMNNLSICRNHALDLDRDGEIIEDTPPTAPENSTTKSCIRLGCFYLSIHRDDAACD